MKPVEPLNGGSDGHSSTSAKGNIESPGSNAQRPIQNAGLETSEQGCINEQGPKQDDNDAEIVTEMERMRARQMRLFRGIVSPRAGQQGGFTLNSRGSSTSPLPLTQKQREDMDSSAAESTPREQKQDSAASDRSRSREAARSGKDPRSLDLEYQALLQQYAQDALREEFLMSELGEYGEGESVLTETTIQNPPTRATEQRSSKANGESRRRARGNYGGARKSPALGAADYLGKPGEPRRVRADITRFVERRRQIDPIGADIRSRERQVKLMKQQQQRQARKAYMEKLKQRQREFHS